MCQMGYAPCFVAYQRRREQVDTEGQAGTCVGENSGGEEHLRLSTRARAVVHAQEILQSKRWRREIWLSCFN